MNHPVAKHMNGKGYVELEHEVARIYLLTDEGLGHETARSYC